MSAPLGSGAERAADASRSPLACRLGYIDFLNSRPVYHALETGAVALPEGASLVKAPPTTLNAKLAAGEIDVSPVSSIEFARNAREYVLLPGLSINSTGFVHSVTLFYRNDFETVRDGRIAVTDQSATSDLLLRILLEERFGMEADVVKAEPDPEELGKSLAGALLIGDNALRASLAYPNLGRRDLGLEWTQWTGRPMVFAVWAARRAFVRENPEAFKAIHNALLASKAWGDAHRDAIVERARREAWLSRDFMQKYFRGLHYDLGREENEGLARFWELAAKRGAIPEVPSVTPGVAP